MALSITGLVAQKGDIVFINSDTSIGLSTAIPTPDGGAVIDGNYWAIPVNEGVYAGFIYQPYNASNPNENTAPNPFAFAVTKISQNNSSDWYYIIGTVAQYITASNGGAALPTAFPYVIHSKAKLAVCQTLNTADPDSGLYVGDLGVPTLDADEFYYAFGYFKAASASTYTTLFPLGNSGYSTLTLLVAAMNTFWGSAVGGTFTKTADNLTVILTQSAGSGGDVFCGRIINIETSL